MSELDITPLSELELNEFYQQETEYGWENIPNRVARATLEEIVKITLQAYIGQKLSQELIDQAQRDLDQAIERYRATAHPEVNITRCKVELIQNALNVDLRVSDIGFPLGTLALIPQWLAQEILTRQFTEKLKKYVGKPAPDIDEIRHALKSTNYGFQGGIKLTAIIG